MGHLRQVNKNSGSLHQRIIADRKLGLKQKEIAAKQGCSQSTVSEVLAAAGLRTYKKDLYDAVPESVADKRRWVIEENARRRAHAGSLATKRLEQAMEYVKDFQKRLEYVKRRYSHISASTLCTSEKDIEKLRSIIDEAAAYIEEQPRKEHEMKGLT